MTISSMKGRLVFFVGVGVLGSLLSAEADQAADAARNEIAPLFAEMQAAANAHDTDRHLAFYAREPSLLFVINDEAIHGWEALREKQLQWWNNGKSDVVYTQVGEPDYRLVAPGLVMLTHFLKSRRTLPDGETRHTGFGISALWQKRPEGWRIIYAHESTVQK
jgi:ketosteroid isomerase-like protein